MKKQIGFVAHGPASANSLMPLIKVLSEEGEVDIHLFAFHPFVANLWGCEKLDITPYALDFSGLDLVVYGTGSSHNIERVVPIKARSYGVTSISILDCYWSDKNNLFHRFNNQPDYIIVPNKSTKELLDQLQLIPEENILPLGNPHFDRLGEHHQTSKALREPFSIAFFSQCSNSSDFSETDDKCKEALKELSEFRKQYPGKIDNIFIAPHPREDITWLNQYCSDEKMNLLVGQDSFQLMLDTDITMGVTCTLQYEAEIIGKPVVFYKEPKQLFVELKEINTSKIKSLSPIEDFAATKRIKQFIMNIPTMTKQLTNV